MSSWKRTLGQWSICKSSFKMKGPNECRLVALLSLSKNCLCTLMPSITNSNRNVEANQSVVYCFSGSCMHQSGCLCLKYTESLSGCVGEGGGRKDTLPLCTLPNLLASAFVGMVCFANSRGMVTLSLQW